MEPVKTEDFRRLISQWTRPPLRPYRPQTNEDISSPVAFTELGRRGPFGRGVRGGDPRRRRTRRHPLRGPRGARNRRGRVAPVPDSRCFPSARPVFEWQEVPETFKQALLRDASHKGGLSDLPLGLPSLPATLAPPAPAAAPSLRDARPLGLPARVDPAAPRRWRPLLGRGRPRVEPERRPGPRPGALGALGTRRPAREPEQVLAAELEPVQREPWPPRQRREQQDEERK